MCYYLFYSLLNSIIYAEPKALESTHFQSDLLVNPKINLMKMKKAAIIFLFLVGTIANQAQKIHVIIFSDTSTESDFQTACIKDEVKAMVCSELIEEILRSDSSYQYELLPYKSFIAGNFTKEKLESCLENLKVEKLDIVFFYFSGHGLASMNEEDEYPDVRLNKEAGGYFYCSLTAIDMKIKEKNPRARFVIADCCNNTVSNMNSVIKSSFKGSNKVIVRISDIGKFGNAHDSSQNKVIDIIDSDCDTKHFVRNVLACSSSIGQSVKVIANKGSAFTIALLKAIDMVNQQKIPDDWNCIFSIVKEGLETNPVFTINGELSKDSSKFDYMEELSTVLDKTKTLSSRISIILNINNAIFSEDAVVETVSRNEKIILDRESSYDFLKRIAISSSILEINNALIVKWGSDCKIKEIRISENRKRD